MSLRIYIYSNKILVMNRADINYGVDITNKCENIFKKLNIKLL